MKTPPLEGVTVVAIEQAVAGPFATRHLADLGARVIKIERPDGGDFARGYDDAVNGLASWFVWLNRGKESVTLDLKRPEAGPILTRLLGMADVFVQNLAPGATDRLGLGSDALRARHPRLVVCNISGYGRSGPYANKKAYDLIIQSEVGMLSITGTGETPCKVGVSIADISAGMYAYSGILAALLARKDTGEGTVLDVALIDTLGEWMTYAAYYTGYGGAQPPRTGASHATIAPVRSVSHLRRRRRHRGAQQPGVGGLLCARAAAAGPRQRRAVPEQRAARAASRGARERDRSRAVAPARPPTCSAASKRPTSPTRPSTASATTCSIRS